MAIQENQFKVRKGLIVNGSGSVILDVQGSQGQLFSVTDNLSGSLFSVSDISGIPIMEVFSDDTINLGTFGDEAIVVEGNTATVNGSVNGSLNGTATNADQLDNEDGTYYLNYNNLNNTPTIGNATITISAGGGLSTGGNFTTNQTSNETITLSHADTSTQGSVNLSGGNVIQDISLDGYGHITNINSTNLDSRYYTEGQIDNFFSGTTSISGYNKSNWDVAYGDKVNSMSFNTGNGVLTLTRQDGGTVTEDLDGRYTTTAVNNATITLSGGDGLETGGAFTTNQGTNETITLDVDSTVVRTSGTQTIGGSKTFSSSLTITPGGSNIARIILDTSNAGSPQISMDDINNDMFWALGGDDADNSFKIQGSTSSSPTINNGGNTWFEIRTNGILYNSGNRLYATNYHPEADTLTNSRNIALSGAVTGNANFDGSSNITISTSVNHNHDSRYYTEGQIQNFFSGTSSISGYNKSNWDSAYNDVITGVSGNGDSTLTLTRRDGGTVTTSLAHSHGEYYESGDTPSFNAIDFSNNEQSSFNTDGRLYWDLSAGLYIKSSNSNSTAARLLWSGANVTAGGGISISYGSEDSPTISHSDTSSQGSVNNGSGTVIQDISLDGYGHITNINSVNLDGRYYTESQSDSRFINSSGDTMTGTLTINNTSGDCLIKLGPGVPANDNGWIEWRGSSNSGYMRLATTDDNGTEYIQFGDYDTSSRSSTFTEWLRMYRDRLNMSNSWIVATERIGLTNRIYHEGDTNTYMQFHAGDQWRVVTGGAERLEANNSGVKVSNSLTVNGQLDVYGNYINFITGTDARIQVTDSNPNGTGAEFIFWGDGVANNATVRAEDFDAVDSMYLGYRMYHRGDTNTYIQFHNTDQFRVVTGGSENFEVTNTSVNIREDLLVDNGTNTTVTIQSDDTGASELRLQGNSQGTGRLWVGQNSGTGGGIEYNGDNSPAYSGAGADFITLYRRTGGTSYWTARNKYNSNNWEFRGDITSNASDGRLKENVRNIDNAVSKILSINGIHFDWKDECEDLGFLPYKKEDTGVIAQEIEKVLPNAVRPAPFDSKYLTVQYEKLTPLLIEGIKEQHTEIEKLKEENKEIRDELSELKEMINQLIKKD